MFCVGTKKMKLALLSERFAVCRFSPQQPPPSWFRYQGTLTSITYTSDECSIICPEDIVPHDVQSERGWKAIKVIGPLDFSLMGVLASLTTPLADAQIPLFALSTFDTDYLLIKETYIEHAQETLIQSGHSFVHA
jgi:hypothetical protein